MDLEPCDSHTVSDQPCEGRRGAIVLIRAHQGQEPDSITACPTHAAAIMATTSGWQAHPGPGDPTGWWAATAMSWSQGVESVWVPPAPGNII